MRFLRRLVTLSVVGLAIGVGASPAAASSPSTHWGWPLAGPARVTHGFNPPLEAWLAGHRGVDLLGRPGEPVLSAGAGIVHFAGRIGGVGVVSVLHPDGLLTTYQPVHPLVHAGAAVRRGQPLGRLLRAGSHCAPATCLHWGLRRGTSYVDPLSLVGAARVRLLPLHPVHVPAPIGPMASAAGVVLVRRLRPAQQPIRRNRSGP